MSTGRTVTVDYRFAEGQSDRIVGLAAELVQLPPDVLVVLGLLVTDAIEGVTDNRIHQSIDGRSGGRGLRCQPGAAGWPHHKRCR